MTYQPRPLPHLGTQMFLAYTGMETDLIFNQGVDLPDFAAFPLLQSAEGRARLEGYFRDLIGIGRTHGSGVILESPTWMANRDRSAGIGFTPSDLAELNKASITMLSALRVAAPDVPIISSANIGPRGDAYAPAEQMTAAEATAYHAEQVAAFSETEVDVISGYTIAYPGEAVGIVRAAQQFGLPVVIAFTLETDGRLPTGETLEQAITAVDAATKGYAAYFMVNCAHPEHIRNGLTDGAWPRRVGGLVANASRCSHAELDEAEHLDTGNPEELGKQLADIRRENPWINVLGGCCGTDMRHLTHIAAQARVI